MLALAQRRAQRAREQWRARLRALLYQAHPVAVTAWAGLGYGLRRAEARAVLTAGPTTGKAHTAEAIAGWRHPERGDLPPAQLLAAVDRAGGLTESSQPSWTALSPTPRTGPTNGLDLSTALNRLRAAVERAIAHLKCGKFSKQASVDRCRSSPPCYAR